MLNGKEERKGFVFIFEQLNILTCLQQQKDTKPKVKYELDRFCPKNNFK